MAWTIEIAPDVVKALEKGDRQVSRRIVKFLFDRVAKLDNPRAIGEALQGSQLGNYWKYRVGDHRIIAHIEDAKVTISVLRIGDRKEIYRR